MRCVSSFDISFCYSMNVVSDSTFQYYKYTSRKYNLLSVHRCPFPPSLKSYCVRRRGMCCVCNRHVTAISDFVAVIVIRVSDTMHLVAENQVCVTDTNRSVTDSNVYTSHIGVCITGPDANTAEMGDFAIETKGFISILKLLFPILRWACLRSD
jgi:hypothetical protein